jgi:hypothetical protein
LLVTVSTSWSTEFGQQPEIRRLWNANLDWNRWGWSYTSLLFIFATEDGTISGWSPGVDVNNAVLVVDSTGSATSLDHSVLGAVYKG